MQAICIDCKKEYILEYTGIILSNGSKNKKYLSGIRCLGKRCQQCQNKHQQNRRSKSQNKTTRKYEKTKNGYLMRTYRNMLSRVNGILKSKNHLYLNKSILNKEIFYIWSLSDESFNKLYDQWVTSDYKMKLSPSIDRINSELGYDLENIRWITHSDNSSQGAISRHSKRYKSDS